MDLYIQIKSFAISFLIGIIYSLLFNIFFNLLFTKYKLFNIVSSLILSMTVFGIYFYLLYIINNGIIHPYFLSIFFISFIIYSKIFVKLRVKLKK